MIKIEDIEVIGWEPAIRGMRNPMNSWKKSDSYFFPEINISTAENFLKGVTRILPTTFTIGPNDHDLMMRLAKAGPVHAKYRRMIVVYMDITAPLYWWKEFDTYKVGTVSNSCSTMHKIHDKEFTLEDFSCEYLDNYDCGEEYSFTDGAFFNNLRRTIEQLNVARKYFLETNDKTYWWQMIQLLPSSYNQKRTIMLSYETLAHMYAYRKDHKLDEWRKFCKMIESLPYSELITLKEKENQ